MNPFEEMWVTLGITPTSDKQALRHAYMRKLKVTNPEDDPEGFKKLREAYELALNFGEYSVEQELDDDAPQNAEPAGKGAVDDPPKELVSQRISPADAAVTTLEQALAALARELRREDALDEPKAHELLREVLSPGNLERLDLLQRLDTSLAELLASSIPRSDPLLASASASLEWDQRERDASLPHFARRVLNRLTDLAYFEQLKSGHSDEAAAWSRLAAPPVPALRWVHAFVLHHSSWPELTLIDQLQEAHPDLIAQLNADNVKWWLRFAGRPRISAWTVGLWLVLSFSGGVIAYSTGEKPPDPSRWHAGVFYSAVGFLVFGLLHLYAIEWPIVLSQRRWPFGRPAWLLYDWLPTLIVLLVLGLLARGIQWLAWLISVGAVAAAFWATIAAGPVQSIFKRDDGRFALMKSRLFRIALFNLLAAPWLYLVAQASGDQMGLPLILTIAALLCASGVGRDLQINAFGSVLPARSQELFCWGAVAAALILGFFVLRNGDNPVWQPALFVAVLGCTVLRRAAPFDLEIPAWGYQFSWLLFVLVFNVWRHVSDILTPNSTTPEGKSATDLITVGSLIFLTGVLIAAGSRLSELRKASGQPMEQS